MALGAVVARIVSQYSDKGSKAAQRDIAKLGKNFDAFSKKATKAFGLASGAAVAFATKIGVDAVKAAIEDQKSQALLANSLRNTVGATDSAIASVEDYITKQQKLFSVADDQLRPSLAALAAATGSITEAQKLQSVALDIAANKQIDLVTASKLLAKAHGGNIGALKKLYPEISANTVKSKDFASALDVVAKASSGAAAAAADTLAGRLEGLKLAYGEVLETLGYALLPVITEFASYIQANVLPALEAWTSANKDKIANSLKSIFDVLKTVIVKMGEFFGFISRNIGTLKLFGAIMAGIFVGGKIAAGIGALVSAIGLVTTALTAQTTAASTAAIATGFATAGVSLTLGAAAAVYFYKEMGKVQKSVEGATTAINEQTTAIGNYSMSANRVYESTEKVVVKLTKTEIAAANAAKKSAAEAAAAAKKKADSLKAIAALTKAGATATSETDPIQLEAARLNLVKQGAIAEQARFAAFVAARKFEIDANNAAAESAKRYNDILMALADAKITPAEFELLAAKWGITTNAAQLYVQTVVSIRDNDVSAADVAALAESWGVTYQQAATYLGFFAALNDGTLSDAEIGKLQDKWGLTSKQVTQYSEVFAAADDGKIDLTEISALASKWGMTNTEAEDYVKLILAKFGFETTNLDGPISLEKAWTAAYGSANAYKGIASGTFTYDPSITSGANAAKGAWDSATASAIAYSVAANAQVKAPPLIPTPSSGNAGGFGYSVPQYIKDQYPDVFKAANGGIFTSPTMSLIGESGPEAVIPLSQLGSIGGGGGSNITINVGGSVISEGDLVATIRNELLALQQSGSTITRTNLSL
ncbi:hypothetical protein UFOVP637_19 [uncultured Caudovirales phage]|uniref:Uncharacterized protein n=1 Tax=uncultured Caudovirales phage TaxID=2100421 RepID=A0A6J5N4U0_9CAUD|nr:hypothetical protein UFOVP637_19 [uncultured Caudovirales phage]